MVPTVGLGIYLLVNVVKLHYNGPSLWDWGSIYLNISHSEKLIGFTYLML